MPSIVCRMGVIGCFTDGFFPWLLLSCSFLCKLVSSFHVLFDVSVKSCGPLKTRDLLSLKGCGLFGFHSFISQFGFSSRCAFSYGSSPVSPPVFHCVVEDFVFSCDGAGYQK